MTMLLPMPSRDEVGCVFPLAASGVAFAGLHQFNASLRGADVAAVRDALAAALDGLAFEPKPRGIWTYECREVEPETGAFLAWTPGRDDLAVSLTGTACELLGVAGVLALARRLAGLVPDAAAFRVTRLDVAWDTELFGVADVVAAYSSGNCVTRSRTHKFDSNNAGSTFYIGKRGEKNARLVRFYDKRGPTRVELELHDERATALAAVLLSADADAISGLCLGSLVDFVDFRHTDADSNVTRCPRVSWWAAFVGTAQVLPLPVSAPLPTLDRVRAWVEDSTSSALAVIFDAMGETRGRVWLSGLLDRGRERRSTRHAARLDITNQVKENSLRMREHAFFRH